MLFLGFLLDYDLLENFNRAVQDTQLCRLPQTQGYALC